MIEKEAKWSDFQVFLKSDFDWSVFRISDIFCQSSFCQTHVIGDRNLDFQFLTLHRAVNDSQSILCPLGLGRRESAVNISIPSLAINEIFIMML